MSMRHNVFVIFRFKGDKNPFASHWYVVIPSINTDPRTPAIDHYALHIPKEAHKRFPQHDLDYSEYLPSRQHHTKYTNNNRTEHMCFWQWVTSSGCALKHDPSLGHRRFRTKSEGFFQHGRWQKRTGGSSHRRSQLPLFRRAHGQEAELSPGLRLRAGGRSAFLLVGSECHVEDGWGGGEGAGSAVCGL